MAGDSAAASAMPQEGEVRDMIARWAGPDKVPSRIRVVDDTTDFFRVDYDDVLVLGGRPYLVRHCEREGRFGIDDEPKYWVRRAVDLADGSAKVVKMVFHERFIANVGGLRYECVRSPAKEAAILDMVRGHANFMQGFSVRDRAGNIIRVIDRIRGVNFAGHVAGLGRGHEDYFHEHFPAVFDIYIELVEAMAFLHSRGMKHGDIRRDHIIIDSATGRGRWIDFDFDYLHRENMFGYDMFGLGNILVHIAGRGDVMAQRPAGTAPKAAGALCEDDMNIIFNNRVVNLRKVYPYIPSGLNDMLMHFSVGAEVFYEDTAEFLEDLHEARAALGSA